MSLITWGALMFSLLATTCSLFFMRRCAPSWGLLDHPSERKLHQEKTPLVGGIAVAVGIGVSLFWWLPLSSVISSFLVGAAVVVFVGMLDDIYDVSIRVRFVGQTLAACVVIISGDTALVNMGNLFAVGDIKLSVFALPVTVIGMVGIMNAFNMIDGIDGFLGISSLVAAASLAILSGVAANDMMLFISLVLVASLLPYLALNLLPAGHRFKVFMGDAGSLLMGFSLCWLFIVGSQQHLSVNPVLDPVTALYLVAVPLIDIFTVMARRIKQKRSPYAADRQHIHHLLGKAGLTERQSLLWLTLMMLIAAGAGVALQLLGVAEWLRVIGFAVLAALYVVVTKLLKKRMTKRRYLE